MPEDKPSVVGLIEGAVYFFSRKPRILEVDTPFFDAAVEGTEFLVRVEPQRAQLTVFDGKITARNAQGELTVANGQSLAAEAGQAPAPSVLVRPRDAVQWALFYPIILLPLADRSGAAAREIAGPLGAGGRARRPRRVRRRLRRVRGHSGRRSRSRVLSLPGGDAAVGRAGRRGARRHRPGARPRSDRRPRLRAERGDRGGAERARAGARGRGSAGSSSARARRRRGSRSPTPSRRGSASRRRARRCSRRCRTSRRTRSPGRGYRSCG